MNIELATISDCYLLAIFKKKMWNQKYHGIFDEEMLSSFHVQEHARKFQRMIFQGHQKLYVLWDDKVVKGYVSFGIVEEPFQDYQYEISSLYVDEGYQEYAKKLFRFAKEEMAKQGIHRFIVSCNKYCQDEIVFYQKMGGEIIYTDVDHRDRTRPQIILCFQLEMA